jgi:hypothetical protein
MFFGLSGYAFESQVLTEQLFGTKYHKIFEQNTRKHEISGKIDEQPKRFMQKKSSFFIALCLENHCQLITCDKILKLSVLQSREKFFLK